MTRTLGWSPWDRTQRTENVLSGVEELRFEADRMHAELFAGTGGSIVHLVLAKGTQVLATEDPLLRCTPFVRREAGILGGPGMVSSTLPDAVITFYAGRDRSNRLQDDDLFDAVTASQFVRRAPRSAGPAWEPSELTEDLDYLLAE